MGYNIESFIERAKTIHGSKYNYDKVKYCGIKSKVIITCPIHGDFKQTPDSHINNKHGCCKCGRIKQGLSSRNNTNDFIKQANKVHNNFYDYSKTIYEKNNTKVIITCPIHGDFEQTPSSHLLGCGCSVCVGKFQHTLGSFIEKSKSVHGDRYDYTKVNFKNTNTQVEIICPEHGSFWQIPFNHFKGHGCGMCGCGFIKTTEEFIRKATVKHGTKYDYINSIYISSFEKIKIICSKHGEFEQTPANHLWGQGCPICGSSNGYSKMEKEWLDSLNIPSEFRSITTKINGRVFCLDAIDMENKIIWEFHGDFWHGNPNKYNGNDVNIKTNTTFGQLYEKTISRENTLKEAGYSIITIWESDWKELKKSIPVK